MSVGRGPNINGPCSRHFTARPSFFFLEPILRLGLTVRRYMNACRQQCRGLFSLLQVIAGGYPINRSFPKRVLRKALQPAHVILTWRDRGAWLPKRVLTKARRLSLHSPLHAGLGGEVWLILRVDARRIIFARVGLCACRRPRTQTNKRNSPVQVTFSDFNH